MKVIKCSYICWCHSIHWTKVTVLHMYLGGLFCVGEAWGVSGFHWLELIYRWFWGSVKMHFGMNKYYASIKGYSIYLDRYFIGWLEHKHTRYCNCMQKCIELILRFDYVTCHLLDFSYMHSILVYISANDFIFLLF